MTPSTLKSLLDEIDALVADAETTPDHDQRIDFFRRALSKTCKYLKGLNRHIPQVVNVILADGGFDPAQRRLPLRDIVQNDPELEVFREKSILAEFLLTTSDLLKLQMNISAAALKTIMLEVEDTYDHFMETPLAITSLAQQFERLQGFFCRPPWRGPGGSLVGPSPTEDGPKGVTKTRLEEVRRYIETVTAIGPILLPIIEKIAQFFSTNREIPASARTQEYPFRVLALVLVTGLVHRLESRQEISEPVRVLELTNAYRGQLLLQLVRVRARARGRLLICILRSNTGCDSHPALLLRNEGRFGTIHSDS